MVRTDQLADYRIFKVRRDLSRDPRNGQEHAFYVIEVPDWINVVPLTPDGRVVLIEQYRPGTKEITLEIPGGMVDEGELPADTAARELLEETGYRAARIEPLGRIRPNPAIQSNWLHLFVARDSIRTQEPQPEGTEQIAVRVVALDEVPQLIALGTINHALVVAAFSLLGTNKVR